MSMLWAYTPAQMHCPVKVCTVHEGESPAFGSPSMNLIGLIRLHGLQWSSHGPTGAIIVFSCVS